MTTFIGKSSVFVVLALAGAMAQGPPAGKPVKSAPVTGKRPVTASSPETKPAAAVEFKLPDPVPIPEMGLEELPAGTPIVSYRNGQLFVDTDNAKLGDVLNAIVKEMGAQIDMPPATDTERVAAHLSGPPRRVISALLDDGKFGYAILYPPDNPDGVQKLVLRSQSQGDVRPSATPTTQLANRRGMIPPPAGSRPVSPEREVGLTPDIASSVGGNTPTGAQAPAALADAATRSDSSSASSAQVTPDALLQDNMAHASKQLAEATAQLSADSTNSSAGTNPSPDAVAAQQSDKSPMQVLQDLIQARRQLQMQQNQAQKVPQVQ